MSEVQSQNLFYRVRSLAKFFLRAISTLNQNGPVESTLEKFATMLLSKEAGDLFVVLSPELDNKVEVQYLSEVDLFLYKGDIHIN